MQITIPPIILPPITPPASKSHQANILLDQTHYHLQKLELVQARRKLFEAYTQYQLNDALYEEVKSYFFLLNGYILMLMVERQQFDEILQCTDKSILKMEIPEDNSITYLTQHFMKASAQSFLNSIELVEIKDTIEKATPRIYLGALYYFTRQYEKASYFFKQAEALSVSAEGKDTILYNISCYNLIVLALNQFLLYCNQLETPRNPLLNENIEQSIYCQQAGEEQYFKPRSNPRFDKTPFDIRLSDNNHAAKEFVYEQKDYATELYNLGAQLDVVQSNVTATAEDSRFKPHFNYEPITNLHFSSDSLFPMLKQAQRVKETFRKLLGTNVYVQNCEKLESAIEATQKEVQVILDRRAHVPQTLMNCKIYNKQLLPLEDVALLSYAKRFSQIENTAKKGKKKAALPKKAK